MTRLVAALGALAALVPAPASADPTAPQVAPNRAAREDAQQVDAVRRELAPGPSPAATTPATPATEATVRDHERYRTGMVIAGAGALTVALSLVTLASFKLPGESDPSTGDPTPGDDSVREVAGVFLVAGIAAFVGGVALMATANRKVLVAPTASSGGAGLAVVGTF